MKRFFNNINMWTPVWMVAILAFVMTLIYVPTFSNMLKNIEELPVVVVNEDLGGTFHDEEIINLGLDAETALLETTDVKTLKWTNTDTREEAMGLLNSGKAVAALVIPKNYTESIETIENGLLANLSGIEAANVEIIVNEASGQSATGVTTGAISAVVDNIANSLTVQFSKELSSSDNQLSTENALLLAQPLVATQVTAAAPLTDSGMSSFILGMILIIASMMGSSLIKSYVNGTEKELQPLNHKRQHYAGLHAEIIFGVCLALLMSTLAMIAVFGIYKVPHTTNLFSIFLFMILGTTTMFMLYTMFSILVGLKWSLLINFPLNIMGIMASGGSISLYGVPSVVRVFSHFHPSRYVMDGLRSLVYYNGRMDSGLGKSLLVLSTYLVITTVGCYLIYYTRRPKIEE